MVQEGFDVPLPPITAVGKALHPKINVHTSVLLPINDQAALGTLENLPSQVFSHEPASRAGFRGAPRINFLDNCPLFDFSEEIPPARPGYPLSEVLAAAPQYSLLIKLFKSVNGVRKQAG